MRPASQLQMTAPEPNVPGGARLERALYDIIDTMKEGANRQNAVALSQPVRGEVRYRQVSFGYETSIDALKDITLHARPGQMIALVGPHRVW